MVFTLSMHTASEVMYSAVLAQYNGISCAGCAVRSGSATRLLMCIAVQHGAPALCTALPALPQKLTGDIA